MGVEITEEDVLIRIHITKDILKRSADCDQGSGYVITSCAFALAVRDILPNATVYGSSIIPFPVWMRDDLGQLDIQGKEFGITPDMQSFIMEFDKTIATRRPYMKEQSFDLLVPNWVIEQLTKEHVDFAQVIANSKTLELIQH